MSEPAGPDTDPDNALWSGLAQKHLAALDGLRLVAVLMVILYHFGLTVVPGGHGVMIFFVLSGFLITWLLLNEFEKSGTVSLAAFYRRRVLRIFPAFYAFWILWTAAELLFNKPVPWAQATSALVYATNYYNAIMGDPNTGYSHTWSLAIEEQFYLLWPAAFLTIGNVPARRIAVLAGFILVVWIYRTTLSVSGVDQGYIYAAFDTRADHLAVGCLVACILRYGYFGSFWRVVCLPWMSLLTLAAFATSVWFGLRVGTPYRDTIGFAIDPLLIALLLAQTIALRNSILWRWLNWRWVRLGGTLSYSIYLYQQVLIHPIKHALATTPWVVQLVAVLAAIGLAAGCSYVFIEKPFLRLKSRTASLDRYVEFHRPARTLPW